MNLRHALLVTWSAALCLAIGFLVAFQLTREISREIPPHAPDAGLLSIMAVPEDRPAAEALADIQAASAAAGATLYRVRATPGDPTGDRQYDHAAGPPTVAPGPVDSFDPADRVHVNPLGGTVVLDPVGYFTVEGASGAADQVAQRLASSGYEASSEQPRVGTYALETLMTSGLGTLIPVALLSMVVTALFDASRRSRVHAVQTSLGHGHRQILLRDLTAISTGYLPPAALLVTTGLVSLFLFNSWTGSRPLLAVVLALVPGILAMCLVLYAMAYVLAPRVGIRDAIAGRQPHRAQSIASIGVACVCLMVVAGLCGTSLAHADRLHRDVGTLRHWADLDGFVAVNYLDPDDPDESFTTPAIRQFADYARQRDRSGDALLFYDSPGGLVVNDAYLKMNGWPAVGATALPDGPTLLVPEGTPEPVAREAAAQFAASSGWFGGDLTVEQIATHPYPSGRELDLFNPLGTGDPQIAVDPIMLRTGPGLSGIPDALVDGASVQSGGGDLLLRDPGRILADLQDAGFRGSIARLIDIAEQGRLDLLHAQTQLTARVSAAVIGGLVLLGLGSVMVGSHLQTGQQRIRARVTHGGGFIAVHHRFIVTWAGLSSAAVAAQHLLSGPHPADYTVGTVAAWSLMLVAVLAFLRWQHSTLIRTTMRS